MVQLMMMRMMRGDGAAIKDILDEERRPAGGGSVLTWLCLLLLTGGRLHLPFLVLCTQLCTRLGRAFRGYILAAVSQTKRNLRIHLKVRSLRDTMRGSSHRSKKFTEEEMCHF